MTELSQNIDNDLARQISADVRIALQEDQGSGDLTAELVPKAQQAKASVRVRDDAVICGIPWFNEVFHQLASDIRISWTVSDGQRVKADTVICELEGSARPLLTGERTALNFLQTLSATATAARAFSIAVENTPAAILDTRKTLPGLRLAQKYAVKTGGGTNHRKGLYDGILIKENHVYACGSITAAVTVAIAKNAGVPITVETETLEEAREAMAAGAKHLLLDNFTADQLIEAVALRNQLDSEVKLEASGGVNLDTIQAIAETGIDYISVGSLTKDIRATDLSMRFEML